MRITLTSLLIALASTTAHAACKQTFSVLGQPLLSQIEYRTSETYKGLGQTAAAKRIVVRLQAEGYFNVRRKSGVITALQETSGSGRPQELRFIITERGGETTIEAIFTIPQGQVAGEHVVRNELCRLIATAAG